MRCPVTPLVAVTGGLVSPKTLRIAADSAASLSSVEVPWAFTCPITSAAMSASASASCMHAAAPAPPSDGAVMWKASELTPYPATSP